jgi:hypothetical protein
MNDLGDMIARSLAVKIFAFVFVGCVASMGLGLLIGWALC